MCDAAAGHTAAESAALYAACGSADPEVQTAAYQTLWRYLYGVALHVVRDQPDAEALAQDCVQAALLRIHQRLADCREPEAFSAWARRIASHAAIDELRRLKRLVPLDPSEPTAPPTDHPSGQLALEEGVLTTLSEATLRRCISQAPISERSRRVVLGRYFDDIADEALAQAESARTGRSVLPSHVQVTRARDIARLRTYEPLQRLLRTAE